MLPVLSRIIRTAGGSQCRSFASLTGLLQSQSAEKENEMVKALREAKKNQSGRNIFDSIVEKQIKVDVLYEDDHCMAFKDVNPQAPTHFLVIPKTRIQMLEQATDEHESILGKLLLTAKRLANERLPNGYRVVINNGPEGCQSVYYLHVHVIGGRQLTWPPG
ncbi:PREDICTED: uncharacterized HIT-like protein Synpcc7942_1390 [Nicrophorus vespilloides]|uniref:Uncharacterized HIT-like protein Synpcc7942_1390 n=1 Tax=Nicrophorus vespilloides TaxID=110193 RepID=A0ABM1N220_NICVS|nr:PREDICTED: uncharacterized HIT-like protein Synpcc7942_1390 [Nicrophorus vespilloides]